jgi:tetratricopeptide (TPR) repeat protein
MLRTFSIAVVTMVWLGGSAEADSMSEAKRLAARAQVHYDLGEYRQAIADYEDAYRIARTPGFLYNLAQSYRLAGDCASASSMYRNYLRLAPRSPYRALAREHIANLEDCATGASFDARLVADVGEPGRRKRHAGVGLAVAGTTLAMVGAWGTEDGPSEAMLIGGGVTVAAGALLYYLGWRADTEWRF